MRVALLAFVFLAGCAAAQAQPVRESIVPPGMERAHDDYHYSPAMRAGDFIYVSGVPAGRRAGEETDEAAFERAFTALSHVLRAAGADWGDVVEITTYHTDLPAQFAAFAAVKDRYVAAPYPAWTALDIDRLLPDGAIVEVRLIAYAPRD